MADGTPTARPRVTTKVLGNSSVAELTKDLATGAPQASGTREMDDDPAFTDAGAIPPPYNPEFLVTHFENSNVLRQCIDAYAHNIDGWGYHFTPRFNFDAKDIDERIEDAILVDADQAARARGDTLPESFSVSPAEVERTKKRIRREMKLELNRLNCFFEFAVADRSFTQLRKDSRFDREMIGHSFWEVRRDAVGRIAALNYVPGFTVRAIAMENDIVEREIPVRVSPLRLSTRLEQHRARRFVQMLHGTRLTARSKWLVYFKEFGDPRVISRQTGKPYASVDRMTRVEGRAAQQATEIIVFRIHTPCSGIYGIPRWIGNLKSVMGSRKAEYVNLLYFENKAVPPLAIIVAGGTLTEESVARIESFIEDEIKGSDNFHKVLLIEAESIPEDPLNPANSGTIRVELVPLNKAIHNDALFMKYDASNRAKVSQSMRIPPILRADTQDFNRATAEAAIRFAEEQVFSPERDEFDWFMNRFMLPALDVKYWDYRSNSPISTDLDRSRAINDLVKQGVLTPREARRLASRVFNEELDTINEEWVDQPLQLTLARQMTEGNTRQGTGTPQRAVEAATNGDTRKLANMVRAARARGEDVVQTVSTLLAEQERMLDRARRGAQDLFEAAKAEYEDTSPEPEVVRLKWNGPISQYFAPNAKPDTG